MLYKSKIDGKFKLGYIPFSIIACMLIFIFFYPIAKDKIPFLEEHFLYSLFFFIVLEIVLIIMLSPDGKIFIGKNDDSFEVIIKQGDKVIDSYRIIGFTYWWNYDLGPVVENDNLVVFNLKKLVNLLLENNLQQIKKDKTSS